MCLTRVDAGTPTQGVSGDPQDCLLDWREVGAVPGQDNPLKAVPCSAHLSHQKGFNEAKQ